MIRIIWRLNRAQVQLEDLRGVEPQVWSQFNLPEIARISSVFPGERIALQEAVDSYSASFQQNPANDLVRYFQTFVPDENAALLVWKELNRARGQSLVDWFDFQTDIAPPRKARPALASVELGECEPDDRSTGATRPFEKCQGYLNVPDLVAGKKQGVGARYAWTLRGGRGEAVKLVDIEVGWNLDHQEFHGRSVTPFGPIVDDFHGTAVLGILWGNARDSLGVTGIVAEADIGLAPFNSPLGEEPNPEAQVGVACGWLGRGDVLLLEVKATRLTMEGHVLELPIEAFEHGQAAINTAHEAGVYVVEAAANGNLELTPDLGIDPYNPALMVGAGHPVTGKPIFPTNWGSRVDLQGWGQEVVTAGSVSYDLDDLQRRHDSGLCYTRSFSDTSSAAAIVAGCVAAISSVRRAHGLAPLPVGELKSLLRSTGTFGSNGRIGPLPNLQAALEKLERAAGPGFQFNRI